MWRRFVTINGTSYEYAWSARVYDYSGYEDNDLNSGERAAADQSSQVLSYYDTWEDFYSTDSLIDDAYNLFLVLGQR